LILKGKYGSRFRKTIIDYLRGHSEQKISTWQIADWIFHLFTQVMTMDDKKERQNA